MESLFKLLENEHLIHQYARKGVKYLMLLYLALYIYSYLGGSINLDFVFNDKKDTFNWYNFYGFILSFKLVIPVFFIFVSYCIFWVVEKILLLVFKSFPIIWINKKLRDFHNKGILATSSSELDPRDLLNEIQATFDLKVKVISRFFRKTKQEILDLLDNPNGIKKVIKIIKKAEKNLHRTVQDYIEMASVTFFLAVLLGSEIFEFLNTSSLIFIILKLIIWGYFFSRLVMILLFVLSVQIIKLVSDFGIRFIELKSIENKSA